MLILASPLGIEPANVEMAVELELMAERGLVQSNPTGGYRLSRLGASVLSGNITGDFERED